MFKRDGDNLLLKKTLTLSEALTGFSYAVRTLDGRDLLIQSPPGDVIEEGDAPSFLPSPFVLDPSSRNGPMFCPGLETVESETRD